ncbi:MAG TPA: hypothetical protein PK668_05940 [Myxococcota bacterium]|nr:hypothetical protein [Myxococcota bacterium]HRY92618.1 hypothetical protein [Myxococcota bacterium]
MGKKKTGKAKAGGGPVERLAAILAGGEPGELGPLATELGLTEGDLRGGLDKARALTKAPDPRQVTALPAALQLAFVSLAAEAQDDEQLNDLLSMTADKDVKKEARRALHLLQSRGVKVDIPVERGASVLDRPVEEKLEELPCYLSPVGGNGSRMVLLARYTHGGVAVHQGEINDQDGLAQFAGGVIGRNRYRKLLGELEVQADGGLLGISFAEARWRVAQAAELTRKAGKSLPDGYLEASGELGEVQAGAAGPDPRALLPAESLGDTAELLSKAGELFEHPAFADWLPEEDVLKLVDEKIKEVESSQVAINDEQRVDGVNRALDAGVAALIDGDRRARLVARVLEQAAIFQRLDKPALARQAAAAAYELEKPDLEPVKSVFLSRMLRRVLRSPEDIVGGFKKPGEAPAAPEAPADPANLIVKP